MMSQKNLELLKGLMESKVTSANNIFVLMEELEFLRLAKNFSFKEYEYLMKPYSDTHPSKFIKVHSSRNILGTFFRHCMMYKLYLRYNIFFILRQRCYSFFKRRGCSDYRIQQTYRQYISDTDTVGLKRVNKSFIYFRGMKSNPQLKSVPADKTL
jgi:hypothetical protein